MNPFNEDMEDKRSRAISARHASLLEKISEEVLKVKSEADLEEKIEEITYLPETQEQKRARLRALAILYGPLPEVLQRSNTRNIGLDEEAAFSIYNMSYAKSLELANQEEKYKNNFKDNLAKKIEEAEKNYMKRLEEKDKSFIPITISKGTSDQSIS